MWVVGDVVRAQAHPDQRPVQHLVSLVSVEDDATGEEFEVVWEIEPGTRVRERAELAALLGAGGWRLGAGAHMKGATVSAHNIGSWMSAHRIQHTHARSSTRA